MQNLHAASRRLAASTSPRSPRPGRASPAWRGLSHRTMLRPEGTEGRSHGPTHAAIPIGKTRLLYGDTPALSNRPDPCGPHFAFHVMPWPYMSPNMIKWRTVVRDLDTLATTSTWTFVVRRCSLRP